jgi:hypothetical protein
MNDHQLVLVLNFCWVFFVTVLFHLIDKKLDTILFAVNSLLKGEHDMDADIQSIIDQATKNEDAEAAADTALAALFAKLTAAIAATPSLSAADRTILQAKVKEMSASSAAVAAAIVANTPAA